MNLIPKPRPFWSLIFCPWKKQMFSKWTGFKIRKILIPITLVCASICLPLLITEISLRLFTPDWLELRMRELTPKKPLKSRNRKQSKSRQTDEVGSDRSWPIVKVRSTFKSFKPNSSFSIDRLEHGNRVKIDEFGGRETAYKEDAEILPFLGDSFTFGTGVNNQETYVSILSSKARSRFLNLGVPGSALHGQNDIVKIRHNELEKPNLYIFSIYVGNDFTDIHQHYLSKSNQKKDQNKNKAKIYSINNFVHHNKILKRIYTLHFFRRQILLSFIRKDSTPIKPIFQIARKDTPFLANANLSLKKELARLKARSNALDFDVFFIVLPDVYQINRDLMKVKAKYYDIEQDVLDMLAPNRILEKNFRDYQIDFIDTTDCLMNNEQIEKLYYIQDDHFTKYGHEAAADCIEKQGFYTFIKKYSR